MEIIAWTKEISVGVARIDEEHQTLLAMLNELGQAMAADQGGEAVKLTSARMRAYAQQHFKTEEEAMTATKYPARTSHVAEHDAFIEKVLDLEDALGRGESVPAKDLWTFLRNWLSEHIQGPDKLLGEHVCAAGMK
ncbi:MAG: bacteriohemerythrin [Proteobacteria bacterium]|nr:bacteriohemerythrin [Pseudomonadota bacterium]